MSWSLSATGHKKAVKRIIGEQAVTRYDDPNNPNSQQKARAAHFIAGELDRLTDAGFVRVEAHGTLHNGTGNVRIEITPVLIHLDEPSSNAVLTNAVVVQEGTPAAAAAALRTVTTATAAEPDKECPQTPAADPSCPDCGQTEHSRGCPKY